ncbi:hypothetical protein KP509_19G068200 [Ceratopteris richardii]|uniref:alpha-L-fucosidase n=1 Tax=Ceratopteris richardii TaxID=49495 RepID=A0A8T2SMW1_CERRI|nr:hypothetical protein KP509_19G068200 [Ceratopteris richardii]
MENLWRSLNSKLAMEKLYRAGRLLTLMIFLYSRCISAAMITKMTSLPPLIVLPIPSQAQLQWQQREVIMFLHFGMNTFTDREWGSGAEDPRLFNPSSLNASQWVSVAKQLGISLVILTAKHHDGFCLWPSAYTDHSVSKSPWKRGKGDVVGELAKAAQKQGIELGMYLSPWDEHDPTYGNTLLYSQYYMGQLRELLTGYGHVSEIWFDGAKGKNAPDMKYMFKTWFAMAHQLQPSINIFSDAGPDVRWVGNENAACGSTCWSLFNTSHARIGVGANPELLNSGDPHGVNWVPPECDVSIRPGWFWHEHEQPKKPEELLAHYYTSVGRNCVLLLNVPPNSSGLISTEDINVLATFKQMRDAIFGSELASKSTTRILASSYRGPPFHPLSIIDGRRDTFWAAAQGHKHGAITLTFAHPLIFNVVELKEPIELGQRVAKYVVKVKENGRWKLFTSGTTIGYRKLDRNCTVNATHVELVIQKSRGEPLLSTFALYHDSISSRLSSCSSSSV